MSDVKSVREKKVRGKIVRGKSARGIKMLEVQEKYPKLISWK